MWDHKQRSRRKNSTQGRDFNRGKVETSEEYRCGKCKMQCWLQEREQNQEAMDHNRSDCKMNERRKWKSKNDEEGRTKYRRLNYELRREIGKAKEQWWENECKQLEELAKKGRSVLVYEKVRQLTWKNTSNGRGATAIKDSTGNMTKEPEEIRKRWKNYIEMLYDKKGKPTKRSNASAGRIQCIWSF